MEVRKGVIRKYDAANHTADVQLIGSMPTLVRDIEVAHQIGAELLGVGTLCGVLFFLPGGPGVVVCTWGGAPPAWITSALVTEGTITAADLAFTPLQETDFCARGDLLVGKGSDLFSRLGVGSDGQVLTADSTQTLGVKWGSSSGVSFEATGGRSSVTIPAVGNVNTTVWYSKALGGTPTAVTASIERNTNDGAWDYHVFIKYFDSTSCTVRASNNTGSNKTVYINVVAVRVW